MKKIDTNYVSASEQTWRGLKRHFSKVKNVYHANVPSNKTIGRYTHDFPVQLKLARGTQTAVMNACRKYLGRSYLAMRNWQIIVHKEGTWIYHNGILYLKNPADEGVVTLGVLTKGT